MKVGKEFPGGFREGDRVSFPGNHASAELLTVGQERCRVWKMPDNLPFDKAAPAVIARYGLGASVRAGITLGRSGAVLGLGIIGQFSLRCMIAAGMSPVVGIDAVKMRRDAALAAGADHVIDPTSGDTREQLAAFLGHKGRRSSPTRPEFRTRSRSRCRSPATAGQVVVVGSPRGRRRR